MEIDRTITNIWTIVIHESEVFERVTDESLMASYQRAPENPKEDGTVITDDDRAFFERYYRASLAELSALLAKRTAKYGGGIRNERDPDTGFITTTYTLVQPRVGPARVPGLPLPGVHHREGAREVVRPRDGLRQRRRAPADPPRPQLPPLLRRAARQTHVS